MITSSWRKVFLHDHEIQDELPDSCLSDSGIYKSTTSRQIKKSTLPGLSPLLLAVILQLRLRSWRGLTLCHTYRPLICLHIWNPTSSCLLHTPTFRMFSAPPSIKCQPKFLRKSRKSSTICHSPFNFPLLDDVATKSCTLSALINCHQPVHFGTAQNLHLHFPFAMSMFTAHSTSCKGIGLMTLQIIIIIIYDSLLSISVIPTKG